MRHGYRVPVAMDGLELGFVAVVQRAAVEAVKFVTGLGVTRRALHLERQAGVAAGSCPCIQGNSQTEAEGEGAETFF